MKKQKSRNRYLISAIVITKNEEKNIADCLDSLRWVDEIVVVDSGSTDNTIAIAKKYGSKIVGYKDGSYSDWRNKGFEVSNGKWLFYVDADERVSDQLHYEVKKIIDNKQISFSAYAIPRSNIILGKEMRHGGWWPDYVKRLLFKKDLSGWKGKLHEQPDFKGELGYLKNPLIHHKYDNLGGMVIKTNEWSATEANMLFKSGHPKMVGWRFLRIMLTELWYRLIVLTGFLDRTEGVIYAFYQMWSRFITYAKLWEIQIESKKRHESGNN